MARANVTFNVDDDAAFDNLMEGLRVSPVKMVEVARTLPTVDVEDLPDDPLWDDD